MHIIIVYTKDNLEMYIYIDYHYLRIGALSSIFQKHLVLLGAFVLYYYLKSESVETTGAT
jgi:hypothetical protein